MMKLRHVLITQVRQDTSYNCPFSRDRHLVAADLLLLYSHTDNFIDTQEYSTFSSSPILVYARELGPVSRTLLREAANKRPEEGATGDVEIILKDDVTKVTNPDSLCTLVQDNCRKYEGFHLTNTKNYRFFYDTKEQADKAHDLVAVYFCYATPEEPDIMDLRTLTRRECEDMWDKVDVETLSYRSKNCGGSNWAKKARNTNIDIFNSVTAEIKDYLKLKDGKKENIDKDLVDGEDSVAKVTKVRPGC